MGLMENEWEFEEKIGKIHVVTRGLKYHLKRVVALKYQESAFSVIAIFICFASNRHVESMKTGASR